MKVCSEGMIGKMDELRNKDPSENFVKCSCFNYIRSVLCNFVSY